VEIGSSGSLKSDINVTPLVDVMLVMLIIFMLVTPLLQKGVGVTLPEARNVAAVSEKEDEILVVAVTAGGQMFVGKDPIDKTRLGGTLKSRIKSNPALQLQIRADRNAQFKNIREIVRAGRDAGFGGVALIADEIKDEGQAPQTSSAAAAGEE
jgi:biopolymer transport protein ExbD/biopolymer transport protein TolR